MRGDGGCSFQIFLYSILLIFFLLTGALTCGGDPSAEVIDPATGVVAVQAQISSSAAAPSAQQKLGTEPTFTSNTACSLTLADADGNEIPVGQITQSLQYNSSGVPLTGQEVNTSFDFASTNLAAGCYTLTVSCVQSGITFPFNFFSSFSASADICSERDQTLLMVLVNVFDARNNPAVQALVLGVGCFVGELAVTLGPTICGSETEAQGGEEDSGLTFTEFFCTVVLPGLTETVEEFCPEEVGELCGNGKIDEGEECDPNLNPEEAGLICRDPFVCAGAGAKDACHCISGECERPCSEGCEKGELCSKEGCCVAATPTCGDRQCEGDEEASCQSDCVTCGDGLCEFPEENQFRAFICVDDCCGNGVCGWREGSFCPADCCGDEICQVGENFNSCPQDCLSTCGNQIPEAGEDCDVRGTCASDNGICLGTCACCGDGVCKSDLGENPDTCPSDCLFPPGCAESGCSPACSPDNFCASTESGCGCEPLPSGSFCVGCAPENCVISGPPPDGIQYCVDATCAPLGEGWDGVSCNTPNEGVCTALEGIGAPATTCTYTGEENCCLPGAEPPPSTK